MTVADLIEILDFNRTKTLAFIEGLAKAGDVHPQRLAGAGPGTSLAEERMPKPPPTREQE